MVNCRGKPRASSGRRAAVEKLNAVVAKIKAHRNTFKFLAMPNFRIVGGELQKFRDRFRPESPVYGADSTLKVPLPARRAAASWALELIFSSAGRKLVRSNCTPVA